MAVEESPRLGGEEEGMPVDEMTAVLRSGGRLAISCRGGARLYGAVVAGQEDVMLLENGAGQIFRGPDRIWNFKDPKGRIYELSCVRAG